MFVIMLSPNESAPAAAGPPITGLVPMTHVADVERSTEFYRLLKLMEGHTNGRIVAAGARQSGTPTASSSFRVHGALRPDVAARILATVSGETGAASWPHARRT